MGGRQRALFRQWQWPLQGSAGIWRGDRQAKPNVMHQERAIGQFQAEHLDCGKSQANSNPTVWTALRPWWGRDHPL